MPEITTIPTTTPTPNKRRRFGRVTEILVPIIVIAVILILAKILISQLSLRNEVKAGRVVTDKTIAAVQKQDATTVHNLGDKTFQSNHNTAELTDLLKAAHSHVSGTPIVTKQIVTNAKDADTVSIIYKFKGQETFYVKAIAGRDAGTTSWQLISLSGNSSENKL